MAFENVSQAAQQYWRERRLVVGAFWDMDFLLFDRILTTQPERGARGDLLEIGALYGKSAIVLGCHAAPVEKVIVCDIFNDLEGGTENVAENAQSYIGLNRKKFENNYRRWVDRPPVVIEELSEHLVDRVAPRSLRFAHIDGSHLYEVVRTDITNVRGLMNDTGVVVMDDYRAMHTPGVAAAVWEAVFTEGLIPICLSEQKFYGAWNPETAQATSRVLTDWVAAQGDAINYGMQDIAGASVLVVENPAPWRFKSRVQRVVPSLMSSIGTRPTVRPYLGSRVREAP
jgi:hypothetical protein